MEEEEEWVGSLLEDKEGAYIFLVLHTEPSWYLSPTVEYLGCDMGSFYLALF